MIDIFGAFVASIATFIFSFWYYTPFFMGSEWMKAVGMDDPLNKKIERAKKGKLQIFFINFLVNLLTFLGISYIFFLVPDLWWDSVIIFVVIFWFIASGVDFIQALFQEENVFTHLLSSIDDFVRLLLGGSILFLMM